MNYTQAQIIQNLDNLLWSEEDLCLSIWLQDGMPNDTTFTELRDDYTTEDFLEWLALGSKLLRAREDQYNEDF